MPSFMVQQESLQEMADDLLAALTPEGSGMFYRSKWMGPFAQTKCWVLHPDGQSDSPAGPGTTIKNPRGLGLAETDLRKACYVEGKGTWFGIELLVTREGSVTAKYNYDNEPEWTRDVGTEIYAQEQEEFPRDLEHQPEWFKEKLALGQVELAEWRRSQGL